MRPWKRSRFSISAGVRAEIGLADVAIGVCQTLLTASGDTMLGMRASSNPGAARVAAPAPRRGGAPDRPDRDLGQTRHRDNRGR